MHSDCFVGSLPEKDTVKQYGTSLYYKYEHYLWEDFDFDNFVILVDLEFPEDIFEKRYADLEKNAFATVSSGKQHFFFMNGKMNYDRCQYVLG